MGKLVNLDTAVEISKENRKRGLKVGLITGCFDIIHISHIQLFKSSKEKSDTIIVGLDSDESILKTKGKNRPMNDFQTRAYILEALIFIDYVFPIPSTYNFEATKHRKIYDKVTEKISPDYLFTNPYADKYWKEKSMRAKRHGGKLIKIKIKRLTSTSEIVRRLEDDL